MMGMFDSLASVRTEEEMLGALQRIGERYGKVLSVKPFAPPSMPELAGHSFVLEFDRAMDAIEASRQLDSYLLGFSSVWLRVPRALQAVVGAEYEVATS